MRESSLFAACPALLLAACSSPAAGPPGVDATTSDSSRADSPSHDAGMMRRPDAQAHDATSGNPDARAPLEAATSYVCPPVRTVTAPIPDDTWVFDSDRTGNHEIYLMRQDGTDVVQLTHDAAYECWWGKIPPDRRSILFTCAPFGNGEDYLKASLWLMNSDGSQRCILRAEGENSWTLQGHEEWSPDGKLAAIAGGLALTAEIFAVDVADAATPARISYRDSITTDVSWAPDGHGLLTNSCATSGADCQPAQFEIFTVTLPGGVFTRLTHDDLPDYDPYYSPDMTRIAWLRHSTPPPNGSPLGGWGIYMMAPDGGDQRPLIDDGNINSKPAWSLDGGAILFHRLVYDAGTTFEIWSIVPDGGGLQELTTGQPGNNEFPSN